MNEIHLTLTVEEINAIITVLGDLPTKTGVFPLIMKIKQQAEAAPSSTEITQDSHSTTA
jgi:hypothetical protein